MAHAAECPVAAERAPTLQALRTAADCAESMRLLESCSWGTGQDVEFARVVVYRCERTFIDKLSASQRQSYDAEKERCRQKHASERGTQSVSFSAICQAQLAARYAK